MTHELKTNYGLKRIILKKVGCYVTTGTAIIFALAFTLTAVKAQSDRSVKGGGSLQPLSAEKLHNAVLEKINFEKTPEN